MRSFAKPKVVLSKCIEFANCRYDGSMITSDFVTALEPHVDFIPVCAEMEIGLGVPRDSIRIVSIKGEQRLIQPTTGLDVSEKMRDFSTHFLSSLPEVDGFILKYRSPSCGMKDIKVYSGSAKATAVSKTAHSQKQAKILGNIRWPTARAGFCRSSQTISNASERRRSFQCLSGRAAELDSSFWGGVLEESDPFRALVPGN